MHTLFESTFNETKSNNWAHKLSQMLTPFQTL